MPFPRHASIHQSIRPSIFSLSRFLASQHSSCVSSSSRFARRKDSAMDPEPLPDVLAAVSPAILESSAKVGAASGVFGLCLGGVLGTIRNTTPVFFAIGTGIQCSAIGASWRATKSFADIYQARRNGIDVFDLSDSQRTGSNTAAGAFTGGMTAAVFRGRSNVLPGVAMFALFGFCGSEFYNRFIGQENEVIQDSGPGFWNRVLHSRFNPMKILSDEEYENMLQEKLIRLEAEIALIDESIEKIKAENSKPLIHAED